MPDREKVINDLKDIHDEAYDRWVHCQFTRDKLLILISDAIPDAIALLREQGPVKPISHDDILLCGNCRYAIPRTVNYCPKCGRKVEWNE